MNSTIKITLIIMLLLVASSFMYISCKDDGDTTAPTVVSTVPTDNATLVDKNTTISVTFSTAMSTATITSNADGNCTGTFQVSDTVVNFATCVKMTSATPAISNGDKTFTVTPAANLGGSITYLIKVTTGAKDANGNALANTFTTPNGFVTKP